VLGGAEILVTAAAGLEQRDLVVARAAGPLAARQLERIGDVLSLQKTGGDRLADVAAMFAGGEPGIDEDARAQIASSSASRISGR
jgi:hypothetical protein